MAPFLDPTNCSRPEEAEQNVPQADERKGGGGKNRKSRARPVREAPFTVPRTSRADARRSERGEWLYAIL
jgi:hypothetical protein